MAGLMDITPEAFFAANANGKQWTIIHGTVYDISKWFDFHPGGRRLLSLSVACWH